MAKPQIGYAAMLEQFHPTELIDYCVAAEEAGFSGIMAADHLQPWVPQQGNAAFVWAFMAAVAQRTTTDIGPGVCCPSFRMHPVVVAQAAATLAAMYPGRFWLGLGSGEALNEHVVAGYWPEAPERINRMFETIEMFNRLFTGKDVKHDGRFFKMETVRLWTRPETPPDIYVATAGPITARRTGQAADGIITVGAPEGKLDMIREKAREGRRQAGLDPDTFKFILQLHLSWAPTEEEALANAMTEWPTGGMKFPKQDIRSPLDFEQMAKIVRPEDFEGRMLISSDLEAHRREIQKFANLGFDRIYLHNVGRNQTEWIEAFGREVLPNITA
jgi:coenzyme F420-dependent glucose-6-phosphate dehydrogenase